MRGSKWSDHLASACFLEDSGSRGIWQVSGGPDCGTGESGDGGLEGRV